MTLRVETSSLSGAELTGAWLITRAHEDGMPKSETPLDLHKRVYK